MKVLELVKGRRVQFEFYRDGTLWYKVTGLPNRPAFAFPVPTSDTGTGTFKANDDAIFFMRWIRKQLEEVENEKNGVDP